MEIYENTVCLHTSSIVLTLPAAFYNFQLYKASKTHPINEYRFNWAKRRTLLFVPLCFSVLFTAYWYEKSNDFAGKLKEIEQFYMDHKGQDLNKISFRHKI